MKEEPTSRQRRPLLTIEELADYLQVEIQTIYNWRTNGRGPVGMRVGGGGVRYRMIDVEAWIETQMDERRVGAEW